MGGCASDSNEHSALLLVCCSVYHRDYSLLMVFAPLPLWVVLCKLRSLLGER
jgi:hypothetical protein